MHTLLAATLNSLRVTVFYKDGKLALVSSQQSS